jgi:aquaporin Z
VLTRATGRSLIGEFVGTFALVFIGAGSIVTDHLTKGSLGLAGIAAAHALVLAIMISALGHISGGHFNPAVTVALLIARRISITLAGLYVVTQLLAAVVAGLFLLAVFPSSAWQPVHLGTPALGNGATFGTGVLLEAILTFFLVFAVFGVAVDVRGPFKGIAGFGIGLVLGFDILMGGPLTGAAMNPARAFGPALVSGFWQDALVYWIGPLLGAAAAAGIYGYLLLPGASTVDAGAPRERGIQRSSR